MSCALHLYLSDSALIDNVAIAFAALLGQAPRRDTFQGQTEYVKLPDKANYRVDSHTPSLVAILVDDGRGDRRMADYHFECEEGGRLLTMDSYALNIAVARRLTDIFGGRLVYRNTGDWSPGEPDYTRPEYPYNNAQENPGFAKMQKRLLAITPVTTTQILSCRYLAGYKGLEKGFEQ
jgi:hypothetical protein